MPVKSQIVVHEKCKQIEAAIIVGVPAKRIAEMFGVTWKSVYLHRANMKRRRYEYYHAMEKALRQRGITKRNTHSWSGINASL